MADRHRPPPRQAWRVLHPFAVYDAPVAADLATFRKVTERSIGLQILDRTNLLPSMRAIKSRAELAMMVKAAEATAEGYAAAAKAIRPGANERDVQRALEDGFKAGGGVGTGYNSIVGAGLNSTVLHYNTNNQPLEPGELLLIDAAARVGGYTADVTRTFPISGKFTARAARNLRSCAAGDGGGDPGRTPRRADARGGCRRGGRSSREPVLAMPSCTAWGISWASRFTIRLPMGR
jgi:Xaa-Pro aminopeptidase